MRPLTGPSGIFASSCSGSAAAAGVLAAASESDAATTRARSRKDIGRRYQSMRNLLDPSSVAQRLDVQPSDGETAVPSEKAIAARHAAQYRTPARTIARRRSIDRLIDGLELLTGNQC